MTYRTVVMLLLAAGLTGCAAEGPAAGRPVPAEAEPAAAAQEQSGIEFALDRPLLTLKQWKNDGSHLDRVMGRLLVNGRPVAGAVLHAGTGRYDIVTGEDGSFRLQVDRSLLASSDLRVVSTDRATAGGRKLRRSEAERLRAATAPLRVYCPIEVTKVEPLSGSPEQVAVHARIVTEKNDLVSFFQVDKYSIDGTVLDADGHPVQGAVVWINRGEGFGKSTPSDEHGRYRMYYFPEPGEDTQLSVVVGTSTYTLPKERVFRLPGHTSVRINITLPKEGTVLIDHPPNLTASTTPGVLYMGLLAGLDVPEGTDYTVTIPDRSGRFVLKIDRQLWERQPTFFETKLNRYVEDRKLHEGDELPAEFLQPGADAPRQIEPQQAG